MGLRTRIAQAFCAGLLRKPFSPALPRMSKLQIFPRFGFRKNSLGTITIHEAGTYSLAEAYEVANRITAFFGNPARLRAADLGAGSGESDFARQIMQIEWRRLVSVEDHAPNLEALKKKHFQAVRHDLLKGRIKELFDEFEEHALDLGLMFNVLDLFKRSEAKSLMRRIEPFFRRGLIIFVHLDRLERPDAESNEYQTVRSRWKAEDFRRMGFAVTVYRGLTKQGDRKIDAAWAIKRWG